MINPHPVLPEFDYIRPENTQAAIQFLKDHPGDARPYLGGTDCLATIRDRKFSPKYLVDLKHLNGWDALVFSQEKGLTIGAAVNLNHLVNSPEVREHYPLIAASAREVGGYQLRTRATLVGNLCNASPCGDTIGTCLVYAGTMNLIGPSGPRSVPLADFFKGPGLTVLEPGEIAQSVLLPMPPAGAQGIYLSIGRNALSDLAIAAVTVLGFPDGSAPSGFRFRIALTAVAPTVIFAEESQNLLVEEPITELLMDEAADLAAQACKPIDDIRASARYRKEMIRTLTRRALDEVWSKLKTQIQKRR